MSAVELSPFELETIEDALQDAGIEEDDLALDYSGRFMFGERCFGIIGDASIFARFVAALTNQGTDEAAELVGEFVQRVKTDSMARDTIYYFPGILLEEASAA